MKKKLLSLSLSLSVLLSSFLSPVWAQNIAEGGGAERSDSPAFLNTAPGLPLAPVDSNLNLNNALKIDQEAISVPSEINAALSPLPVGEIKQVQPGAEESFLKTNVGKNSPAVSLSDFYRTSGNSVQRQSVLNASSRSGTVNSAFLKSYLSSKSESPLKQLSRALLNKSVNFDGEASHARGIFSFGRHLQVKSKVPAGVKIYDSPKPLDGGIVSLKRFYLAPNAVSADGSQPIALRADPSSMSSIETALRQLVNSNPGQYGASSQYGPADQDMATVHVQRLPAQNDQADSIIAVFRQWKKGVDHNGSPYYLLVDGANLRFHIKVLNGKPVIMAVEGGFAPDIDPEIMASNYTDAQLDQIALNSLQSLRPATGQSSRTRRNVRRKIPGQHLNLFAAGQKPVLLTREIAYVDNAWRAVNIYEGSDSQGQPIIVLVDVKTGEAFPIDSQGIRTVASQGSQKSAGKSITGSASANGTTLTPDGEDHGPTAPMALPNAKVFDSKGNVVAVTDENGAFTIPASVNNGKPMPITVRLDGIYGPVIDDDSTDAPLVVTLTVTPGQQVKVSLNSTGDNEQQNANVNAYVYSYRLFNWFKSYLGLTDSRFYTPLAGAIHANGSSMPGNADYDPSTDGFYLMKQATVPMRARGKDGRIHHIMVTFENTSQPSISLHELGHRFVQRASQITLSDAQKADPAYRYVQNLIDAIMESGANEATADTISMFMRNNPILGNGFIINPLPGMPTIIRTGENKTPFDPKNDDPHAQGETQMGTAWMSRKDLMTAMGEVEGALRAAFIFVMTPLYVQPGDVVSALTHALLADMAKDGTIPHEAIIRAHAQEHGVDLPQTPTIPSA